MHDLSTLWENLHINAHVCARPAAEDAGACLTRSASTRSPAAQRIPCALSAARLGRKPRSRLNSSKNSTSPTPATTTSTSSIAGSRNSGDTLQNRARTHGRCCTVQQSSRYSGGLQIGIPTNAAKHFAGWVPAIVVARTLQSHAKFPQCWSDVSLATFAQEAASCAICAAGVGERGFGHKSGHVHEGLCLNPLAGLLEPCRMDP